MTNELQTEPRKEWFDLEGAAAEYPGVLTPRLPRTLVGRREIAFSRSGRKIVLHRDDIETYLAERRQPVAR